MNTEKLQLNEFSKQDLDAFLAPLLKNAESLRPKSRWSIDQLTELRSLLDQTINYFYEQAELSAQRPDPDKAAVFHDELIGAIDRILAVEQETLDALYVLGWKPSPHDLRANPNIAKLNYNKDGVLLVRELEGSEFSILAHDACHAIGIEPDRIGRMRTRTACRFVSERNKLEKALPFAGSKKHLFLSYEGFEELSLFANCDSSRALRKELFEKTLPSLIHWGNGPVPEGKNSYKNIPGLKDLNVRVVGLNGDPSEKPVDSVPASQFVSDMKRWASNL